MSNSQNFSLIIPAAADKAEYDHLLPRIFSPDKEGVMKCVKSILGLNLECFDNIYFTILRKHADRYDADVLLDLQIRRLGLDKAKIVILDDPTHTQAETVARTVELEKIEGAIFIKDADSFSTPRSSPKTAWPCIRLKSWNLSTPETKATSLSMICNTSPTSSRSVWSATSSASAATASKTSMTLWKSMNSIKI